MFNTNQTLQNAEHNIQSRSAHASSWEALGATGKKHVGMSKENMVCKYMLEVSGSGALGFLNV